MKKSLLIQLSILIVILIFLLTCAVIFGISNKNDKVKEYEYTFKNHKELEEVNLKSLSSKVNIIPTNESKITVKIKKYERDKIIVTKDSYELKIHEKGNFMFFSINFKPEPVIDLYIPKNLVLNYNILLTSGKIEAKNLKMKTANIKVTSGKIFLKKIRTNSLEIETTSGEIKYSGQASKIKTKLTSGKVNLDLYNAPKKITAKITSGNLNIVLPDNNGFLLKQKITSGKINSEFPLTILKEGEFVYKKAINKYEFDVTSGKINLTKK